MVDHFQPVPYNPVPTVTPDGGGGRPFDVRANPEDFGAQIGQSLQTSGGQLQETGAKGIDLATHLGDIYNDASARDGVVKASKDLGDATNEYRQNRGLNAPQALKAFQDKVQDIIYQHANSMPTNGAQKLFMDQITREGAYSIKDAGAWAADQATEAQGTSLQASIQNRQNQFAFAANDINRRSELASGIRDDALQLAHFKGLSEQDADMLVSKNVGAGYASLIKSTVTTNPDMAEQLYNEGMNEGFKVNRNGQSVKIPFMDAEQAAQTRSEMVSEYRVQEGQNLQSAKDYAKAGAPFDADRLVSSMARAGRPEDYVRSQLLSLQETQSRARQNDSEYQLTNQLNSDNENAMNGYAVTGTYTPGQIQAAYPNDPNAVKNIQSQVDNLHIVAGFAGSFQTKTPAQIYNDLNGYFSGPSGSIDTVLKNEGGLSPDGHAIYGIDKNFFPQQFAQAKKLTDEQGAQAGQTYAADFYKTEFWDKRGMDQVPVADRPVVMDGIVNHYKEFGDQLIQAAKDGATPDQLIDMRRQEYQRLATSNPQQYGPDLAGWNSRLDNLQGGQSQLYKMMKSAADQYVQKLNNDPAGTAVKQDQILTGLFNQAAQDPSKMGDFINASLARQQFLGVDTDHQTALPVSAATTLSNSVMSNPSTAANTFSKLSTQYGKSWPDIYHSMVTVGQLSPQMQAVAQLSDNVDTIKDATILSQWYGQDVKGKLNSDLIGKKNEGDIQKKVQSDPAYLALTNSIKNSSGDQSKYMVASTFNSIKDLAFARIYNFNEDASTAASNAVKAFTSKYDFMPNGGAAVPTDKFDSVKQNSDLVLKYISSYAMAPNEYNTGRHGLPTPDEYYNAIKGNHTWVAAKNGNGLNLLDQNGAPVLDKHGKIFTMPYNQAVLTRPYQPIIDLLESTEAPANAVDSNDPAMLRSYQ